MHHELSATLDLQWYRKQAKDLVRRYRDGDDDARARVAEAIPERERFQLTDAQHVIAVEHGFRSWAEFKQWVETREPEPPVGRIGRVPLSMYEERAKALASDVREGKEGALRRVRALLPRYEGGEITVRDAKVVVAREYGFPTWRDLVYYQQKAIDSYEEQPTGELGRAYGLMRTHDVEGLRALLERKPHLVHERFHGPGSTLLEALAQPENAHLSTRTAEILIEFGSELDVPLNLAGCFNRVELVKILLDAGARHDATEIWGITPLQSAIYHGSREAADVLAEVEVVPDGMYVAAGAGRLDVLGKWFDEQGRVRSEALRLRPNLADVGWPPGPPPRDDPRDALDEAMALAAYSARIDVMEFLLARGANPSGAVHLGLTGLHLAVILDRLDAAHWLVEHGADLNAREEMHGSTPLGWAEHNRKSSAVHQYLVSVGTRGS